MYPDVKEHKLNDKERKMDFKTDETMKPMFGEEEKRMRWILRHLKGHLTSPKVASRSQNSESFYISTF